MNNDFYIVAIGASAGGLEAIYELFDHTPKDTGVAFVVVRHLQRNYKTQHKMLISRHTAMEIKNIEDGDEIQPNKVYLMPEDKKLFIENKILRLMDRPKEEILNRAIDEFFISLAQDQKALAIGIILSGTGSDGTQGSYAIEENGGIVIVQNPSEAQFDGMPKHAIYFDHPDYVLRLKEIPGMIQKHIQSKAAEKLN